MPGSFAAALFCLAAAAGPLIGGCTTASTDVGTDVGQHAPPLSGTTIDGRTVALADFRGKPVVVNFWASWCVPCRDEFPIFSEAIKRHPDLVILGVVFQDDAASARAFVTGEGAGWSSVTDPDGSLAKAYRIVAPPQSYFIDRSGVVRSRQIGEIPGTEDFERQYAAIAG